MRDDLSAPNLGQTHRTFDAPYFWQTYRLIEQWMTRVLAKGPLQATTVTATEITADKITLGTVTWTSGTGTPEGSVTANVGSLYTRTDGGASTTLYVKQSGTGNTGWAAK